MREPSLSAWASRPRDRRPAIGLAQAVYGESTLDDDSEVFADQATPQALTATIAVDTATLLKD